MNQKEQKLLSELELLQREQASPDLNRVRSEQRNMLTKKVFEDNLKHQQEPFHDYQNGRNMKVSQSTDNFGSGGGDIFDPLFERPKHWRNFYGNIVQGHQMAKISKHEEKFLQSQMNRDRARQFEIENGMAMHNLAESANDLKKSQDKTAVRRCSNF